MSVWTTALGQAGAWVWRHRWTYTVPVATLLLPATLYAVRLPDTYKARAIVGITPLQPERIGSALPQEGMAREEQVLATIRDRVVAPSHLEAVLPLVDPGRPVTPEAVERFRDRVEVERIGQAAFAVALEHTDPRVAADATNALVARFLDAERETRRLRADRLVEFHEAELAEAREAYGRALDELERFRSGRSDSLPERKDALRDEAGQVQTQIGVQQGLAAAARQRVEALDQQASLEASAPTRPESRLPSAEEEALRLRLAEQQRALGEAERAHADARSRYTEKNPEVERTRLSVEAHRRTVEQTTREMTEARRRAESSSTAVREEGRSDRQESIGRMRDLAAAAAAAAEEETRRLETRLRELRARLAALPETEAALAPLLRSKDEAVRRLESREREAADARAAAAFYRGQDAGGVTGFRIEQSAAPPALPSGPGRWRYLLTALLLGVALGQGALVLRRHLLKQVVTAPQDVASLFPGACVVGVPLLSAAGAPRRRAWGADLGLAAWVALAVGVSVLALAASNGWIEAPAWFTSLTGRRA